MDYNALKQKLTKFIKGRNVDRGDYLTASETADKIIEIVKDEEEKARDLDNKLIIYSGDEIICDKGALRQRVDH